MYKVGRPNITHKKINLRELINLCISDGFYKYQTNYMTSKLYFGDFNAICYFVVYKVQNNSSQFLAAESNRKFNNLREFTKKSIYFLAKEESKEIDQTFTYTQLISTQPRVLARINLFLSEKYLEILLYYQQDQRMVQKDFDFLEVQEEVPFFPLYLQYRQLKILGHCIIKAFRQKLL